MALRIDPSAIALEAMKLGEKIRYLREVEGSLRGLGRAMSQLELVRAIDSETGSKLSQSYLSQIESGARPHVTNTTRQILAGFFKVHPGYLVDDPEGYSPELQSELGQMEDKFDLWLISGAERFRRDPELKKALLTLAQHERSRECVLLLEAILETPGLDRRLAEVLRPKLESGRHEASRKETGRHETEKPAARAQERQNGARKHVSLRASLKEKKPRGGAHK
jgi:transcriptional regulator with XRE-family HTH domain